MLVDNIVEHALKARDGIFSAKRYSLKLIKLFFSFECCVMSFFRQNRNLMIRTSQVQARKPFVLRNVIHNIPHIWQRLSIQQSKLVNGLAVVHAKSLFVMFAFYNFNLRSPGRRTGFDNTITKHFREFIVYELFIGFWIMLRFRGYRLAISSNMFEESNSLHNLSSFQGP